MVPQTIPRQRRRTDTATTQRSGNGWAARIGALGVFLLVLITAIAMTAGTAAGETKVKSNNADKIQQALDACDPEGCEVVVTEGNYTVDRTITVPKNAKLYLEKGAILKRASNFNSEDDDMLYINESNVVVAGGGTFDSQHVTANVHMRPITVHTGATNVRIEGVEIRDIADHGQVGGDACITIWGTNVQVTDVYCHDNRYAHGIQVFGDNVMIHDSIVEDIQQDAYRQYGGDRFVVTDSIARNARVGYQCWSNGQRGCVIADNIAQNIRLAGVKLLGQGGRASGITIKNASRMFVVRNNFHTVSNVYGGAVDGGPSHNDRASVNGDRNTITNINLESVNYNGDNMINVSGDENVISQLSGSCCVAVGDYGTDNQIIGLQGAGGNRFAGSVQAPTFSAETISLPTCDGSSEGDIAYNGSAFYGCDGSSWKQLT